MEGLPRVESKHLFNYHLTGVYDEEVSADIEKMMQLFLKSDAAKYLQDPTSLQCLEFASLARAMVVDMFQELGTHPVLASAVEACVHTKFEVPPRDGNDFSVPVLVHTPKSIVDSSDNKKGNPALIYAHGGGVVSGTAELFKPWLSDMAVRNGVVFFNVDYRLAPETKCPKNAFDFYTVVKHVIENASSLGIDPERIGIMGESGGGYIVNATMVLLAQRDEGHLVKLAMARVPMVDDYHFGDINSMTKEEKQDNVTIKRAWQCIATDLEEQRKNSDPLLFPAKASDELLAKMPPTIIWEGEFDFFITEATRFANRLRAAGRLLELYIAPGMTHGGDVNPDTKVYQQASEDTSRALNAYFL